MWSISCFLRSFYEKKGEWKDGKGEVICQYIGNRHYLGIGLLERLIPNFFIFA
jgi:hypothetical protein